MKETVLKPVHELLGARMVPFGGYLMPVQYTGIMDEARVVRSRAGLFDLGHMGRLSVTGGDADAFLQRLQTNDVATIKPGRIRYGLILDAEGHIQDDVLIYREPDGAGYFVVVNAGNHDRDLEIMREVARDFRDVTIDDRSEELGMVALQGPESVAIVAAVTGIDAASLPYYGWARGPVLDVEAALSRTGYTGEDGFEIYLPRERTTDLWNRLLEVGEPHGLAPCGLGARDILRLEAGMPLYGHEIDETTTPLEAGLEFAVRYTHDFIGRPALEAIRAAGGPRTRLVGLETTSRRVPRQGYPVVIGGEPVGRICSGGTSPTRGTHIATAYVPVEHATTGTAVEFEVRDKREPATIVDLPFYRRAR